MKIFKIIKNDFQILKNEYFRCAFSTDEENVLAEEKSEKSLKIFTICKISIDFLVVTSLVRRG